MYFLAKFTEEVKITEPEVIVWLKDYMKEGLSQ